MAGGLSDGGHRVAERDDGGGADGIQPPRPGQPAEGGRGEGTANVASSGAAKKVVLLKGKKSFAKAGKGKGKVKLKLTKKGKRALKKLKKATIRLTLKFTDKAGRTYNKKITVKVKRKKAKKG